MEKTDENQNEKAITMGTVVVSSVLAVSDIPDTEVQTPVQAQSAEIAPTAPEAEKEVIDAEQPTAPDMQPDEPPVAPGEDSRPGQDTPTGTEAEDSAELIGHLQENKDEAPAKGVEPVAIEPMFEQPKADPDAPDPITGLSLKQERFCQNFINGGDLRDNATLGYAEAYGYDLDKMSEVNETDEETGKEIPRSSEKARAYSVCAVEGSRNLRKPNIQKRMRQLLKEYLNDDDVDSELAKIIKQDYKYEAKLGGIREYNKLKARIIEKHDHKIAIEPITGMRIVQEPHTPDGTTIQNTQPQAD